VPIGRYFVFVGSFLLAMLFITDRYLPNASQPFMSNPKVDKSIIRIKSAHQWPEKIAFDTTSPTISILSPSLAEAQVITSQPRAAFAQLVAPPRALKGPVPLRIRRNVTKRSLSTRIAAYPVSEAPPAGW
jgi:hypothetical protein